MDKTETGVNRNVLVVSEHTNPDKIERHVSPLAPVTEQTTMVCLTPNEEVDINYVQVPTFGIRLVGIVALFFVALREAVTNEYNLVVSFSLFPYGLYGLIIGAISQTPTHLGILGSDLDVHAHAWYRFVPRKAFPRFDSISVLGSRHRAQLVEYGVSKDDVFVLTNAIDTAVYRPPENDTGTTYDFVWSGRFAPEKRPLCFVDAIHKLQSNGHDVQAVMLGDGGLQNSVKAGIAGYGLEDTIELTGWVEEPAEYYAQSRAFVLTSEREALGLSLIESMAMGLACIAPSVGNIPDIAEDEENSLLVDEPSVDEFAEAMERVMVDDDLRERLARNAIETGQSFSYENAREDWREIVAHTAK